MERAEDKKKQQKDYAGVECFVFLRACKELQRSIGFVALDFQNHMVDNTVFVELSRVCFVKNCQASEWTDLQLLGWVPSIGL